jgi:uncharacterized protein (TIGR02996 family)
MTDRQTLLTAALDCPEDDTARLVLADFLQERPNTRGEGGYND